jgi:hypothetical protein
MDPKDEEGSLCVPISVVVDKRYVNVMNMLLSSDRVRPMRQEARQGPE